MSVLGRRVREQKHDGVSVSGGSGVANSVHSHLGTVATTVGSYFVQEATHLMNVPGLENTLPVGISVGSDHIVVEALVGSDDAVDVVPDRVDDAAHASGVINDEDEGSLPARSGSYRSTGADPLVRPDSPHAPRAALNALGC